MEIQIHCILYPDKPLLYPDIGPVGSNNLSVSWGLIPIEDGQHVRSGTGYKITWRRVEGRIDHPGHSSNTISNTHVVRGLMPFTRYESTYLNRVCII